MIPVYPYKCQFDANYVETVILDDGNRVRLRLPCSSDKGEFLAAFARLSARSRYRRFFHPKKDLSVEELRFFTEVDGWDHFALAAFGIDDHGTEQELLGVARFYRSRTDQATAEIAVAVVDHAQHAGIGRLLVTRLVAAASERGIRKLHFYLLPENTPALKLFAEPRWQAVFNSEDEMIAGELRVPSITRPDCRDAGSEFLRDLDVLLNVFDSGALPTAMEVIFTNLDLWLAPARQLFDEDSVAPIWSKY